MTGGSGPYACAAGNEALSSTLWSGGRTRAWSKHLLACERCRHRAERAALRMAATGRDGRSSS